jgi:predicted ATPase
MTQKGRTRMAASNDTRCACAETQHVCKMVALTGGPGAGKTAVLEVVRQHLCRHVTVLPESASIVFAGGFPRGTSDLERRAAQCAIYHVQRQLERIALESSAFAIALCDRGTLDGLAYWPASEEAYFADVASTMEAELSRYAAVIHLRTPPAEHGYDHSNPVRLESARQAAQVDERILEVWKAHPQRVVIDSSSTFLAKLLRAVEAIRAQLPPCCRAHRIPEVDAAPAKAIGGAG